VEIRCDEDDMEYKGAKEIEKLVSFYLVGRAATKALFGDLYYQSKTDFEKASELAKNTLLKYGFLSENKSLASFLQENENALADFVTEHKKEITTLAAVLREDRHFELSELEAKGVL
jgi:ATP-dependent Zn protease